MKIIVTGSRELEYSVPFTTEAAGHTARVLGKMGHKPTAAEAATAAKVGREYARTLVVQEVHRVLDAMQYRLRGEGDKITSVVHGGAPGVDRYAALWAVKNNVPQVVYKPNWMRGGKLNKAAGFNRNWYMLFREAGAAVEADMQKRTGKLAVKQERIARLVAKAKQAHSARWLHVLVPLKVVLEDSRHSARRSVLRRLGVAVPEDVMVVAFHDSESRGTAHCMMAAGQLGYMVTCHTYPKPERKAIETGRINHRPDPLYHELGSGRLVS
jgi:hypothetical protein